MIHSDLEETLACVCPNCGKEHRAKFFSLFVDRRHYVVGDCDRCGYRIEFERDEFGGGIFLPGGDPVKPVFRKENMEHLRGKAEGRIEKTFATMRFRFLDDEPITEERER